jgi:hypothetical protein
MLANTVSPSLLKAIRDSFDRISLEKEFKHHKISSKKQRIDLMLKAMGNPAVSYSCGNPSINERYEIIVGSFLIGFWRKDFFSFNARRKTKCQAQQ